MKIKIVVTAKQLSDKTMSEILSLSDDNKELLAGGFQFEIDTEHGLDKIKTPMKKCFIVAAYNAIEKLFDEGKELSGLIFSCALFDNEAKLAGSGTPIFNERHSQHMSIEDAYSKLESMIERM